MKPNGILAAFIMIITLIGCNVLSPSNAGPSAVSEATSIGILETPLHSPSPPSSATPTAVPPTQSPGGSRGPEEAILILEPGPGSRVVSPVHVAGVANPTFEQTLLVRIVLDDGTALTQTPTIIQADVGVRGPFAVDVPFTVQDEVGGLIQVLVVSPRDGGIVHLASVGVRLAAQGTAQIKPVEPHPERIDIQQPLLGEEISGGIVHVEGMAIASFEGTLVVKIFDMEGNQIGMQPLIVNAPEMGMPGPFSADVAYTITLEGPGRISVIDPLPAFDGIGHISSVEVILKS
jgi:hypothetical protein